MVLRLRGPGTAQAHRAKQSAERGKCPIHANAATDSSGHARLQGMRPPGPIAVLAGGGKEIPRGTVIYKQSGKMYMFDPGVAGNEAASANFQDSFNDWANQ